VERFEAVRKIAAEMMAANSNLEETQLQTLFAGQKGYATPKIDVRGVVFKEGKILLVKELSDGGWTLPGGFADVGDTPSEAVEREVREESGYEVRAEKILAFYDRTRQGHPPFIFHLYKIFFLCRLLGGAAADSAETEGAAFFARDEIPPLSLGRVLPKQILRFFDHLDHPDWPTDFD
jgi:ADP-ribose pyrophosphatase YjhB (NUDIX family)